MADKTNLHLLPYGGATLRTIGSDISVFNTNTLETDAESTNSSVGDTNNPYDNNENVIVHAVPDGASYLDLYHDFYGAEPSTGTQPIVQVFGRLPEFDYGGTEETERRWPQDINGTFTDVTRQWIPLFDPTNPDATVEFEDSVMHNGNFKRSMPKQFYLAGCDAVVVLISTAASGPTGGVISGRFVS